MYNYTPLFLAELEKEINLTTSTKKDELERLIETLDNMKVFGVCLLGNDHIQPMLTGKFNRENNENKKAKENAYMEHANNCPVCYIISRAKLYLVEGSCGINRFRKDVLLHLNKLKIKIQNKERGDNG